MKIGLIIYGSLDLVTGGFLYDRLLVDYLRSRGEEVEVISLPWPSYRRGLLDNFSRTLRK
ncbi:MAG: glycosyltransferase family 1 protein, partial [Deltaproteobacteria bacterium]